MAQNPCQDRWNKKIPDSTDRGMGQGLECDPHMES
jgi:hypothetical protein